MFSNIKLFIKCFKQARKERKENPYKAGPPLTKEEIAEIIVNDINKRGKALNAMLFSINMQTLTRKNPGLDEGMEKLAKEIGDENMEKFMSETMASTEYYITDGEGSVTPVYYED